MAAKYGHLGCLKYAHKNGCRWDSLTTTFARRGGHLECLEYAIANGCPENGGDQSTEDDEEWNNETDEDEIDDTFDD